MKAELLLQHSVNANTLLSSHPHSTRKERKVRPGHVPAEDVAKYRPGQGSLRAQHVAAQANHQAPPSPTPTPASTIRRPNPSDFLTQSKLREQQQPPTADTAAASVTPPSPTKPSKSTGASSSRWATVPSEPTPGPAPAPVPAAVTAPKQRARGANAPRKGKAPAAQQATQAETESQAPEAESLPAATATQEQEAAKENVPLAEVPPTDTATPGPSTPKSKIPDLPETPGGDWWADEDEDEEVDAAAQALQSISIKDAASQQRTASPTPPSISSKGQPGQQLHQTLSSGQGKANHASSREAHPRSAKKPQQTNNTKSSNGSKASSGDLLSRLGPPVPPQALAVDKTPIASASAATSKMTIEEFRTKAKAISQEIRQCSQLQKYAEAGAVLSDEQKQQIDKSHDLMVELSGMKAVADGLADELSQLVAASQL